MVRRWLGLDSPEIQKEVMVSRSTNGISNGENKIRFTVTKAIGGLVVEVFQYDKHQENIALHIITDDQDIGDSLSKILFLENLKR